jgi:TolB-like protein
LLLLFRAGFPCCAQNVLPFDDALKNVVNYLTDRISAGSTVAVLSFQSDYPNLSDYVIDDITSALVNTDRYTVVDRRSLEILAQEMAFQLSGEVSDETALAIGKRLGAQVVISGAITYLEQFYRLRVQAIEVETARIQGSQTHTIQPNSLLASLTGNPWTGPAEPEYTTPVVAEPDTTAPAPAGTDRTPAPASGTRLFYVGLRGGVGARSYELNEDLWGPHAYTSVQQEGGGGLYYSGDFAVQASIQIFKFLALQAEAVFSVPTYDVAIETGYADTSGVSGWDAYCRYSAMMVPVLAKLTFRPGIFLLAGFGGGYLAIPLGGMGIYIERQGTEFGYDVTPTWGFIAGGNIGIKLGPGTLFLDIRYARDLQDIQIKGDWGSRSVYRRGGPAFSMGYEFGLGGVRGK